MVLIEIPGLRTGGWVSVFRASNIGLGADIRFDIRVTFRLEKSFTCHSNNPCLGDACISLKKSLSTDLQRLYLSASSADVSFYIGQESVPAHQLILSARVPYFERLFASDMKVKWKLYLHPYKTFFKLFSISIFSITFIYACFSPHGDLSSHDVSIWMQPLHFLITK